MKKSIAATGVFASSMLYGHSALTENRADNSTSAYQWKVETEFDTYSGTNMTIDEVNKEINELTKDKKILKKNITPIPLAIDDAINEGNKIYTWNIMTKSGYASGVSTNIKEAKKIVESFGSEQVLKSAIIESHSKEQ